MNLNPAPQFHSQAISLSHGGNLSVITDAENAAIVTIETYAYPTVLFQTLTKREVKHLINNLQQAYNNMTEEL